MRNFLKENWFKYWEKIVSILIILIGVTFVLFFVDIGLFSKYFIKSDFSEAFLARQTGNCDKFASYLLIDKDEWLEKCKKEKQGDLESIKEFSIHKITIEDGEAFLQVELVRDTYITAATLASKGHELPEGGYLVNYQMKRVDNRWYINQEMRK